MTHTPTRNPFLRRLFRRAITLTALALFVATAATSLAAPGPAVVGTPAATVVAKAKRSPAKVVEAGDREQRPADKKRRRPPKAKPVTGVVNINTASEAELQKLPGVGPTKAERVVAYRSKRGKFRRVKDLRRVKGFGYKTIKKLEPHLAVTGPTTIRVAD